MTLVTLAEAKEHLRVLHDDEDTLIEAQADAATDIVLDYIERPGPIDGPAWTQGTVPPLVRAAILLVLGSLYADREGGEPISMAVASILRRYRDPALA